MSDHDIDKLFREGLAHTEEPISTADWKQFEELAGKKTTYKWSYLFAGLLLLSISSAIVYFSLNNNAAPFAQTNTSDSTIEKTDNQSATTLSEKNNQSNSEAHPNNTSSETENTINEEASSPALSDSQETSPNDIKLVSNQGAGSFGKSADAKPRETLLDARNPNEHQNEMVGVAGSIAVNGSNMKADQRFNNKDANEVDGASASSNSAADSDYIETQSLYETSSSEEMDASLDAMTPKTWSELQPEFELKSLNEESEQTTINPQRVFTLDVFGSIEFNNELGTMPAIGLAGNWNKGKWRLSAGASISKTGTLNWKNERQHITYGFDRYEEEEVLITENFTHISIPIQVAYNFTGRSGAFIGINPSMVIDAAQSFTTTNQDGTNSTGYLYETGAPDFMLFLSGGYQFYFREDIRLDFAVNYAPQNWDSIEQKPFGGFIRLNYTLR